MMEKMTHPDRDVTVEEVRQRNVATNIEITWISRPGEVPAMGDCDAGAKMFVAIPRRVLAKAMSMLLRREMAKTMEGVVNQVLEEVFGGEWILQGSNDGEIWLFVCHVDNLAPGAEPCKTLENDDPTPPYKFIRYVPADWAAEGA